VVVWTPSLRDASWAVLLEVSRAHSSCLPCFSSCCDGARRPYLDRIVDSQRAMEPAAPLEEDPIHVRRWRHGGRAAIPCSRHRTLLRLLRSDGGSRIRRCGPTTVPSPLPPRANAGSRRSRAARSPRCCSQAGMAMVAGSIRDLRPRRSPA
jgi:hypothetical protein